MTLDEGFEALLRPLIPGYLDARRNDCDALWIAIAARDDQAISDLGHQLVGSGASYGFPQISEVGERLETAGRAQDFEAAARAVEALAAVVKQAFADG